MGTTTIRRRAPSTRSGPAATALAFLALLALSACSKGSSGGSGGTEPAPGARPSSMAQLTILSPTNGETVQGPNVQLKISLEGAHIVQATSRNLKPDEGHIHVSLDGQIVSMTFGLEQAIPNVAPGQHTLRVEFVANDHSPFDPRVFKELVFTVR
jgi:hypothetical protein